MNPNREKWVILITLSLIWGSSFILIKKSLLYFNPYEVGALRVLISGLLLLPIAFKNKELFRKVPKIWLIIAGVCGNFIPMFLFPIAETEISSSIAGIINSMMPIFVIIVGSLMWKFKTSRKQILGVLISFLGACLLTLGSHDSGTFKLIPILLLLFATLLYAISTTTVKSKLNTIPAKILSAFVFGFVLTLPSLFALVFSGFFTHIQEQPNALNGLVYVSLLSILGTGLAMMMNYRLLTISTPLFASTTTLLMPVVAIIWGILDGESLTTLQLEGGSIIIGGLLFLRQK